MEKILRHGEALPRYCKELSSFNEQFFYNYSYSCSHYVPLAATGKFCN